MDDLIVEGGPTKRSRSDEARSDDAEKAKAPPSKRGRVEDTAAEELVLLSDVEDDEIVVTPPVSPCPSSSAADGGNVAEKDSRVVELLRARADLVAAHSAAPAPHCHPASWVPRSFPLAGLRGDGTGVFCWPMHMVHRWPAGAAGCMSWLPAGDSSASVCGAVPPPNTWFVCRADGTWTASPADLLRAPPSSSAAAGAGVDPFAAFTAAAKAAASSGDTAGSVSAAASSTASSGSASDFGTDFGAADFLGLLRQPFWRAPLPAGPLFAGAHAGAPVPAVLQGSSGSASFSSSVAAAAAEREHAVAGATAAAALSASTSAFAVSAEDPASRSIVGAGIPGNELHAAAARLQRVSAFACMTPASFGQAMLCASKGWHPCPPVTDAGAVAAAAASAAARGGAGAGATGSASSAPPAGSSAAAAGHAHWHAPARKVKLLALDVDGTVIAPSDPRKDFCQTDSDWKFAFPSVRDRIRAFHAAGYAIAFVSNQKGISTARTTAAAVQRRFERIALALGVPVLMMAAPAAGLFRKPSPGLLWLAQALCCGGIELDKSASLYVGDAAGRRRGRGVGDGSADHSADDMLLAINAGLPFATAEAFFGGSTAAGDVNPLGLPLAYGPKSGAGAAPAGAMRLALDKSGINWMPPLHIASPPLATAAASASPLSSSRGGGSSTAAMHASCSAVAPPSFVRLDKVDRPLDQPPPLSAAAAAGGAGAGAGSAGAGGVAAGGLGPEIVLLVGPAGCGKSWLALTAFPHHVRINQDLLKTLPACMAAARKALAAGTPVVVDRTHTKAAAREPWLQLAREMRVPARAVFVYAAERAAARLTPLSSVGGGASDAAAGAGASSGAGAGAGGSKATLAGFFKAAAPAASSAAASSGGGSGSAAEGTAPLPYRSYNDDDRRLLKGLCFHLNDLRQHSPLGGSDGSLDNRGVPEAVIHSMVNELEAPTLHEGFAEVVPIRFAPAFAIPSVDDARRTAEHAKRESTVGNKAEGSATRCSLEVTAQLALVETAAELFARSLTFSFI